MSAFISLSLYLQPFCSAQLWMWDALRYKVWPHVCIFVWMPVAQSMPR